MSDDTKKDLETIKAGVLALMESAKPPKAKKGDIHPDFKAHALKQEAVADEHIPQMINAGVRLIGGLFVDLRRIADSIEEKNS
jgi:hypothetical protein